jgi:hypothetical protein
MASAPGDGTLCWGRYSLPINNLTYSSSYPVTWAKDGMSSTREMDDPVFRKKVVAMIQKG